MAKQLIIAIRITFVLLLIVCGVYPLVVWGVSQAAFKHQANGSEVRDASGKLIGSELLAQGFAKPEYFHPRASNAGSSGYDPTASSGTNLGPTSDKLINGIHKKLANGKDDPTNFTGVVDLAKQYRTDNGLPAGAPVPVDAVTYSASGLDPHVSPANAEGQIGRVAKARGVSEDVVRGLVKSNTQGRSLGFLGEPVVNVLMLNMALDKSYPVKK